MKLDDFAKAGGVVQPRLVKKTGKLQSYSEETEKFEDVEFDFFVKLCSWLEMQEAIKGIHDPEANPELLTIAACIRFGENGEEQMSYEFAKTLDSQAVNVFRTAIGEVFTKKN